ncbi:MAG: hypothetical protein TR69_WS6001000789 [candidate division WS6 bacterium OLB20]|uniref:DUF304 domain-containing protein n=1 Tax=candidate division WS6 bacterium OLB20 TaxID=1617426 RepID=A0A136LYN2_9BACT|nr:MAG: hypothetical protein TR69_WS6001000789 [candidate division WS6 bacterium OLB20]
MADADPRSVREILPKPKSGLLGQLSVYPRGVSFATQDRGEHVYILARKHVITNLGWVFRATLLAVLPLLVIIGTEILADSFPQFIPRDFTLWELLAPGAWLVMAAIYYVNIFSYVFARFIDWYFDIYLVTSERFVHIEFRILTGKFISEAPLKNIEDVSQQVVGLFPALFNYGDIIITTASERGKFRFESVPDPTWFRDVLTDLNKLVHTKPRRALEP